jgi:hypothetical protein
LSVFWKRLLRLPNLSMVLTILVGTAASFGLTDRYVPSSQVLIGLVTLVAVQMLADRLVLLYDLVEKADRHSTRMSIELMPRTSAAFARFSELVKGATEVMVIGVDLGYIANADAWFVKQMLASGVDLKLLMISPNTNGGFRDAVNQHDERNVGGGLIVHDHVAGAQEALKTFKSFVNSSTKGRLQIRARVDIPNPTMALVDPTRATGRIRVELKLYKKNHGDVPFFMLDRSSAWYDVFVRQYYENLWNDSDTLFDSNTALVNVAPVGKQLPV